VRSWFLVYLDQYIVNALLSIVLTGFALLTPKREKSPIYRVRRIRDAQQSPGSPGNSVPTRVIPVGHRTFSFRLCQQVMREKISGNPIFFKNRFPVILASQN
jgi:hypothetical protein